MPALTFSFCESVKDIRTNIKRMSKDPVVYRWWFPSIPECLGKAGLDMDKIEQRVIKGKIYNALYVGIGISCQHRFKWHIMQHHTISCVKYGTLSTLRQTLSAVFDIDMSKSEEVVNEVMDTCYLEWALFPGKSKNDLEVIESALLDDGYYPLNIQKNRNIPNSWRIELCRLRKIHKV